MQKMTNDILHTNLGWLWQLCMEEKGADRLASSEEEKAKYLDRPRTDYVHAQVWR